VAPDQLEVRSHSSSSNGPIRFSGRPGADAAKPDVVAAGRPARSTFRADRHRQELAMFGRGLVTGVHPPRPDAIDIELAPDPGAITIELQNGSACDGAFPILLIQTARCPLLGPSVSVPEVRRVRTAPDSRESFGCGIPGAFAARSGDGRAVPCPGQLTRPVFAERVRPPGARPPDRPDALPRDTRREIPPTPSSSRWPTLCGPSRGGRAGTRVQPNDQAADVLVRSASSAWGSTAR